MAMATATATATAMATAERYCELINLAHMRALHPRAMHGQHGIGCTVAH